MRIRTVTLILISMSASLVILMAVTGIWLHSQYRAEYTAQSNRFAAIDRHLSLASIAFKKQVQEWKNVLLRGHVDDDLQKYWLQFLAEERATRDEVAPLLGYGQPDLSRFANEFLRQHANLGVAYRTNKELFRAQHLANPRVIDQRVRGIDRVPAEQLVGELKRNAESHRLQLVELRQQVDRANYLLLLAGLAGVCLILGISWQVVHRRIILPILSLYDATKLIVQGQYKIDIPPCKTYELGRLATAFGEMAGELQSQREALNIHIRHLQAAKRDAEQANASKSTFLSTMSHELRTPLNGIMGSLQLLEELDVDDFHRGLMDTMEECGSNLLALLENLMEVTRIGGNANDEECDELILADFVGQLVRDFGPVLAKKAVELVVEDHLAPDRVTVSVKNLQQIVQSLMSNAIKYCNRGFVRVVIQGGSDKLVIRVEDSGCGMSQDTLDKMYEPFWQADMSDTRVYGGSGIGLTIAKGLVEALGGSIEATSELGQGSNFLIQLPCKSMQPGQQYTGRGMRVMLVGDSATVESTREWLESCGYSTMICESYARTLGLFRSGFAPSIDLMVIDVGHAQCPQSTVCQADKIFQQTRLASPNHCIWLHPEHSDYGDSPGEHVRVPVCSSELLAVIEQLEHSSQAEEGVVISRTG